MLSIRLCKHNKEMLLDRACVPMYKTCIQTTLYVYFIKICHQNIKKK